MENTNIFRAVWKKVLDRMTWRNYDWTVKADLDSVFVPKRLISYVQALQRKLELFQVARTVGSDNMRRAGRGCG